MSKIRMPNTSKPIRHAGAVGAAVRPGSSVTAAAPSVNPDGVGSIAKLDARQRFTPVTMVPAPHYAGLHGQSVVATEEGQALIGFLSPGV